MNFQNLQYFLVVAQDCNISRAAEKLHISQQALSASISRLEDELDCKLFERKPTLSLTYSGKRFVLSATKLLALQKQAINELHEINQSLRGEFRITTSITRAQTILPLLLPEFRKRFPLVELSSIERKNPKGRLDDLYRGNADVLIGIIPQTKESLKVIPLLKERLALVVSQKLMDEFFGNQASHALARYKETGDIRIFSNMPFVLVDEHQCYIIHGQVRPILQRMNVDLKTCSYAPNFQLALGYAMQGVGATICPESYLNSPYLFMGMNNDEKYYIFPFFPDEIINTIGICCLRERSSLPIIQEYVQLCRGVIGALPDVDYD